MVIGKTRGKPHRPTAKWAREAKNWFHGVEPDKIGNLTVLVPGKGTRLKKR